MTSPSLCSDLIEPVTLLIRQINKVSTPYSAGVSGRREPVNHIVKNDITVEAQIAFGNRSQITHTTQFGSDTPVAGHFVVNRKKVEATGIKIKKGDRIVKVMSASGEDELETELFILNDTGDRFGHFTDSGFIFQTFLFSDRNPVG